MLSTHKKLLSSKIGKSAPDSAPEPLNHSNGTEKLSKKAVRKAVKKLVKKSTKKLEVFSDRKVLYVVRHAHRDISGEKEIDNGLSEKGLLQRKRLTKDLKKELGQVSDVHFVTSPKKRCRETIETLSGKKAQVHKSLDMAVSYSHEHYRRAINTFIQEWLHSEATTWVACVHGEWIEAFFERCTGEERSLKKGEWFRVRFSISK